MNSSLRRFKNRGYSSTRPVTTASNMANCVSRPNVNSMKKNSTAQNGEMGIWAIPSGYTTKARPGPEVATSETALPETWAMKPSTLKMTNPANTLVLQFMIDTIMASLYKNKQINRIKGHEWPSNESYHRCLNIEVSHAKRSNCNFKFYVKGLAVKGTSAEKHF